MFSFSRKLVSDLRILTGKKHPQIIENVIFPYKTALLKASAKTNKMGSTKVDL